MDAQPADFSVPLGLVLTLGGRPLPAPMISAAQAVLDEVLVVRIDDAEEDELLRRLSGRSLVVVIDGRCDGVSQELIAEASAIEPGGAVAFVQPVVETMKLVRDDLVLRTVDREQVRVVATPIAAAGTALANLPDLMRALWDPAELVRGLRALGEVELREAPPQVRRTPAPATSPG